jgi:glutathione synthase/RimK-type ligase-like ATP-grasp enzyme
MRCAYLIMEDPGDHVTDYDVSIEPMAALGWEIDLVPWRKPDVDWDSYDAVYVCTPWDYPEDPETFMSVLASIDMSRALLVNSLDLVSWTLEKSYLRDLEVRGVDIVPSLWFDDFSEKSVPTYFASHATDKVVVKPLIGANAADTYVLTNPVDGSLLAELATVFKARPHFVQPFIDNIQGEGEYSLFFFSGEYSHAILKSPKSGDFRVQEEYGADIQSVEPDARLIEVAQRIVALVEPQPVYVRADFVRGDDDRFLLMELELIEPSLYLRTDTGAAERFAAAFDAHVRQHVS